MKFRNRFISAAFLTGVLSFGVQAQAATTFEPTDWADFTQPIVETSVEQIAFGAAHTPYQPASPLGVLVGVDVGVSVTAISLTEEFKTALTTIGASTNPPGFIPLPRLHVSKGLPFGLDLGASYIGYEGYKIFGLHSQYAILSGGLLMPSLSARVSYTNADLFYVKSNTMALDVVGSKKLGPFFDPYVGFGLQRVSGEIDVPTGTTLSVSGEHSAMSPRFFVGLPVKLAFLQVTGQYEYNFNGMSNYGAKFGFSF